MSLAVEQGASLQPWNTFGVQAHAERFVQVHNDDELRQALALAEHNGWPVRVIGGGSNLVLARDVAGLVIRMASRGIRVLGDGLVEAEAGEPWHPFVQYTLAQGLAGLENLSLIPGTVGAAPMQNVGAYGVEVKDVFAGLTALDRHSGELREFSLSECEFGYRDSRFKREAGRWVILRVRFRLSAEAPLHLDYGPVRQRLAEQGIDAPTAQDVSRAICSIRQEKLPDPAVLGNAGSFFKNPVIPQAQADALRERYPDLVSYPLPGGEAKLAAGWLIDKAGWRGYRDGAVGVHALQALVLVNHGGATGAQVLGLAERVQADVRERFGVMLEMEPNVL
ncbi:UDP-N-acetylmuramate dehydrogenase [Pseudomonas sp. KNUC1026]|uniref:UDP-N-acetylmuramate dehydrogenase n=1 Tax=Pseudomonas sp. KNUC1026 TaxID=2893890 RepID=UPI001F390B93|nr:UDP-N-acetylmuramate dehydrogenase [Pseudomonas sp. KNUC1026]UFH50220.1 UDP-N-acetylmuramate dehydrogenase [Pseudomonas sp. KNUC1026]